MVNHFNENKSKFDLRFISVKGRLIHFLDPYAQSVGSFVFFYRWMAIESVRVFRLLVEMCQQFVNGMNILGKAIIRWRYSVA